MIRYRTWLTFSFLFIPLTWAEVSSRPAITAPIPVETLRDFQHYPPQVQHLIRQAAELSEKNLTYRYGSANPNNRGMDCSGTIYYLLKSVKVKAVPRASDTIY